MAGTEFSDLEILFMRYSFNKELYNKEALLKAAYSFTDKAYIHLDADEEYYIVTVEMKGDTGAGIISEKDFQNEILAQRVRQIVSKQTKHVRELMLARAFSSTIIDSNECDGYHEDELTLDDVDRQDILMDWFEKYE